MEMKQAKRVEITIEAPMETRLTDALDRAGVTGYTILPVLGGSGRSGRWSREGQVSRAGGMVSIICIIRPERLDELLEAAFGVVERHIGVVCVSDCQVLRAERF
ncbi:P-II family nitrogen regulator [Roseibium alexandrii]|jgi:nitrogen regulatory protein PII|uniref:Nitrogen regulatory protein P-II n=1 Tax=Roseibium alexandrii (strain DSM 17067 / NCIMB 14079 / DFL-11) TaxID=244592 RepID=A0A5E8H5B9_ROSAD|nr:nitrogen regulatory protein P-II [Roseibium alexandrii]EEE47364.1 Nitrogen regulatory protein PII [Roseibium alexandrii DFL-11]